MWLPGRLLEAFWCRLFQQAVLGELTETHCPWKLSHRMLQIYNSHPSACPWRGQHNPAEKAS